MYKELDFRFYPMKIPLISTNIISKSQKKEAMLLQDNLKKLKWVKLLLISRISKPEKF
jgi:hypothetical protein